MPAAVSSEVKVPVEEIEEFDLEAAVLRLLANEVYPRVKGLNAGRPASSGQPRMQPIAAE